MSDTSSELIAPATVKRLARLVTVLTIVMIVGMVTVVGLLIVRLNGTNALPLPESIALPEGAVATAVTTTEREIIVLSVEQIFIFDRSNGKLTAQIALPQH